MARIVKKMVHPLAWAILSKTYSSWGGTATAPNLAWAKGDVKLVALVAIVVVLSDRHRLRRRECVLAMCLREGCHRAQHQQEAAVAAPELGRGRVRKLAVAKNSNCCSKKNGVVARV